MKDANFYELRNAAKDAVDAVANAGQREQEQAAKSAHQLALAHEALSELGVTERLPASDAVSGGAPAAVAWRIRALASVQRSEAADVIAKDRDYWKGKWRLLEKEVFDLWSAARSCSVEIAEGATIEQHVAKMADKIEEQASELRFYQARDEDRKAQKYATTLGGPLGAFVSAYGAARGQRVYFADREALRTAWAEVVEPLLAKPHVEPTGTFTINAEEE